MADQEFAEVFYERHVDLRYKGQSYEITVPWEQRETFAELHRRLYGYDHQDREVEQVTARVKAIGVLPAAEKIDLAAPSDRQEFSSVYVPENWSQHEDSAGNLVLRTAG